MSGVHRLLRGVRLVSCLLIFAALAGCPKAPAPPGGGPIRIVVSIAPLKGLVEPLVADLGVRADVDLVVPVGAMEHGYEIPPSMIQELLDADVVVYVGLGLEAQVQKLLKEHPRGPRRDVCFADVVGIHRANDVAAHVGSNADEHDHGAADPHLWLDPSLIESLLAAVSGDLREVVKSRGSKENEPRIPGLGAVGVTEGVRHMDDEYRRRLAPYKGRVIITAHAAWGRLAQRYGLEQVPLAGLEANEPSPAAIAKAAELIRERKVRAIFSERQVNPATVQRLADMTGVKVYQLDPLGDGDWFKMMNSNLDALVRGLAQE